MWQSHLCNKDLLTKVTCPWWTRNAFVQWNAICDSNAFIIPKIFISYDFFLCYKWLKIVWKWFNFAYSGHVTFVLRNLQCTKVLCPELFPLFGIYFLLVVGEFVCWCSWQVIWYFVVITWTVNDVNNSSVIYRTSSKVSFASPVKLWKLDMSPLCSKQSICYSIYIYSSFPNACAVQEHLQAAEIHFAGCSLPYVLHTGFPLYFAIEIQGLFKDPEAALSRTNSRRKFTAWTVL